MATSSSDDSSSAPRDFHLSSSLDSGSRLSPVKQKCPLCSSYKSVFFCKECVQTGNFNPSTQYTETYAERQLALLQHKVQREIAEQQCQPVLEQKRKIRALSEKIRFKKERVRLLEITLAQKRELRKQNKTRLEELTKNNKSVVKNLPRYCERVANFGDYVTGKGNDNTIAGNKCLERQEQVKKLAQVRVKQVMKYIFPIDKRQNTIELDGSQSEIATALAEATMTTYVHNRWVYNVDHSGELHHVIVGPSLPTTWNYDAYNDWVNEVRELLPNPKGPDIHVDEHMFFRVTGAMTLITQLLDLLAFYLDVRLPYPLDYSDFCTTELTQRQFLRRVARLNANVLHICIAQGTNLNTLHPFQPLHNILQLLDLENSDLGRSGPVDVDNQIASDLEQQLSANLTNTEDSDSEESDSVPYEWEAVPHVPISDASQFITQTIQSTQMIPTTQVNSMAGGLINSAATTIASIWRGWTGNR